MDARPEKQERWDRRMEAPLAVASLLFLAGYTVRVLAHGMDRVWLDLCLAVTLGAWGVFIVDYVVRFRLSGLGPLRFVRAHLLGTIVLLLPLLRPLQMVKIYDGIQRRRRGEPRLTLYARVMAYSSLTVTLLGFAGALAVYQHERGASGATIRTFGDALWWAAETLTTVGYGDVTPVTTIGRFIAVGMMACGVALIGAVTGSFSSWLIQTFTREDEERPPGGTPGAS
ncbi:Potassium voltage-gated channel subfamily KQT possible potassium channel, VIC family [Streptomyces venezuelae]|uniref:potassium channel family protein n=1 Tax=Streptomyces gardneri TaxID=66892 RepID=UPI0006BCB3BB|nr:potassium channel family protein [Streptomyces gardneri]ALO07119.1 Potassium voltage-gated channel subfamily KQT possible potassium channel, VIC family [Streptomyces venezuelae]QPK44477.1 two pore domain potassium channel family protein [Streptomyces gardneri]WRK35774.1 potassium channel family protein [Streptomyces venezuelae]CUM42573.1 Potassium voltage-gated channel subfamily KQT; possible potassium channel, VIC family [Streptomyces venezuelae]